MSFTPLTTEEPIYRRFLDLVVKLIHFLLAIKRVIPNYLSLFTAPGQIRRFDMIVECPSN